MSPTKVRPFTSPEHARNGGFPTIDEVQQVAYEDPQYDKGATLASSVLRSRGESETPPTDEGSASSSITAAKSHFEGAVAQEGGAGLVFGENGRVALNQVSVLMSIVQQHVR
jgi:hypothetical protein